MEVEYKSGIELAIKVIFGEDFGLPVRLLSAKVETREIEELANAIELIESYNNFEGEAVANALRQMHNEGLIMEAGFGREQSPVLYITPPFWTHQRTKPSKERRQFTEQERNAMFRRIFEILEKTNPDELDLVYGDYQVRAWWD